MARLSALAAAACTAFLLASCAQTPHKPATPNKTAVSTQTPPHSTAKAPPETDYDRAMRLYGEGGKALGNNDPAKALAAYDAILACCGKRQEPQFREILLAVLPNRAAALGNLGRTADAEAAYQEAFKEFAQAPKADCSTWSTTLVNYGIWLEQQNRLKNAIAAYTEALGRCSKNPYPDTRRQLAIALNNRAYDEEHLGQLGAAITTQSLLVRRFGKNAQSDPALRLQVAIALVNKGILLAHQKRFAKAKAAWDQALALPAGSPSDDFSAELDDQFATALLNKAGLAANAGKPAAALPLYEEIITRFSPRPDAESTNQYPFVPQAMFDKAATLAYMGKGAEAKAAWNACISRVEGEKSAPDGARAIAFGCFLEKAHWQIMQKRYADALATYQATIGFASHGKSPMDDEAAGFAHSLAAAILLDSESPSRPAAASQHAERSVALLCDGADDRLPGTGLPAWGINSGIDLCGLALDNSIEPLIAQGKNAEALQRIKTAKLHANGKHDAPQEAILAFLQWLASPKASVVPARLAAAQMGKQKAQWTFSAMRLHAKSFAPKRQAQAKCFFDFFEKRQSQKTLGACLDSLDSSQTP